MWTYFVRSSTTTALKKLRIIYLAFVDLGTFKSKGISFIRRALHFILLSENRVGEKLIGRKVEFKNKTHRVFLQKNDLGKKGKVISYQFINI